MTGMEHAIEQATEAIRHARAFQAAAAFGVPEGSHRECAEYIARALVDAGLLAPAPLREAYIVATWKHTRWVTDHSPDPGETVLRGSHGADALHTECAVCREVLLPARFERLPVDRAEGDGRADQ